MQWLGGGVLSVNAWLHHLRFAEPGRRRMPASVEKRGAMILTGWKEIASHLNCAVRTVQRWERNGLPVNRPIPGRRGHVTADAEMLDSWFRDTAFWRRNDFVRLDEIDRARALRAEARHSRETLRENMASLKKQTELLRRRIAAKPPRTTSLPKWAVQGT